MKPASKSASFTFRGLEGKYTRALREYLKDGGEKALKSAYDVGRQAFTQGAGLLDLAALHSRALAKILDSSLNQRSYRQISKSAEEFLAEALSPFEIAHRGFRDAVGNLRRLNETLEQEIKRIAYTVHDETGQLLEAARLVLAEAMRELNPEQCGRLGEVNELLDRVSNQLRQLSHELRPTILDDMGLVPALRFLADGVSRRGKLKIRVESTLNRRFPSPIETGLYRVVQEALTNVTKHSKARNVVIGLKKHGRTLACYIHDDGVGFDSTKVLSTPGRETLGLVGIQERLNALMGALRIESQLGRGSKLHVTIPLED